jgi:hypothetical protein
MGRKVETNEPKVEKPLTRGERFVAGFVGSIILMVIGVAISLGFSWLLWRFGPFVAFPAMVVPLAILAGIFHATSDDAASPVSAQKGKAE